MRELSDDVLDRIVRKAWGNEWMLPGEPQRMLVRAGYAAGYRAAQAVKPGPLDHQSAATPSAGRPDAEAAQAETDGPAADPADLCAQIRSFLADAPKEIPHKGFRYGELLSFAADALERLARERDVYLDEERAT